MKNRAKKKHFNLENNWSEKEKTNSNEMKKSTQSPQVS